MTATHEAQQFSRDEHLALAPFADLLAHDDFEGLSDFLTHCQIRIAAEVNVADTILAHYRLPIGYDINRVAMDLRTWKPVADRLWQLMSEKAEREATADRERKRAPKSKAKRMNGHTAGIAI